MGRTGATDTNPEYWREYTNLQHVKHNLIRRYLGGWFPKLGFWARRVIYMDTHAGRGAYESGHLGSPLVALDTLLQHQARDQLLEKSEFRFLFIERDSANVEQLKKELASRQLPPGVQVDPHCADAFKVLEEIVSTVRQVAPAFVFVDPYGFKVPGRVLHQLMSAGRVELFINLIWRELDMAIVQGLSGSKPGMAATLTDIFDSEEWKNIGGGDIDERSNQAVRLLAQKIGARWHTHIRMLGDNEQTRYILLHLTNHDEGRDLMKDCMWKVAPDGGFYASKSADPGQLMLITPTPNLRPLRDWVVNHLKTRPRPWRELHDLLRAEVWREPHLNEVVRALRKEGTIQATDFVGTFSAKANPLLSLTQNQ